MHCSSIRETRFPIELLSSLHGTIRGVDCNRFDARYTAKAYHRALFKRSHATKLYSDNEQSPNFPTFCTQNKPIAQAASKAFFGVPQTPLRAG